MGFIEAIKNCTSNWITFSGRASRSEYWWFTLFNILFSILGQIAMGGIAATGSSVPVIAFAVVFVVLAIYFGIAGISVMVRRLHDKDKSGWWYWIILVPIIGVILLLVWFCQRGTQGPNRFGPDPLMGTNPEVFA
jgi:uncharacterized membrane protein YhaH (DUF805 family)